LPELVSIGNRIFGDKIHYIVDFKEFNVDKLDVIFFGASFQNIEILENDYDMLVNSEARYIMIADCPLTAAGRFCSIQMLGDRPIPSIIHNKQAVADAVRDGGYDIIAEIVTRDNEYCRGLPLPWSKTQYYHLIFKRRAAV
jgi:putative methyltransferase (TIGR04325 family)